MQVKCRAYQIIDYHLAFLGNCDPSWYFQNGRQYNYEVITQNSVLFADKGITSNDLSADERLEGSLSVSVVGDCIAEASYVYQVGRSRQTSSARVHFGTGHISSIAFPEGQSEESNDALKATFSALQLDQFAVANHPTTVGELTHNGFSDSFYECDCGCTDCKCEHQCPTIFVTRRPTMMIDTSTKTQNPILHSLLGKATIDMGVGLEMGDISCTYDLRGPIPERVHCVQNIQGNEIENLESTITLTLESESSATTLVTGNLMADEDIKITHTPSYKNHCAGTDMSTCISNMLMSVTTSDSEAVKSQFLLRRSIRSMTEEDIMSMLNTVSLETNTMTYLFTELAQCESAACNTAMGYLLKSGTMPVYPSVYRALQLQKNPTELLVQLVASDIAASSSVEKLNILLSALKRVELSDYQTIINMLSTVIGNCATVTEEFTFLGYFTTQRETTETEMVLALRIAQMISAEAGVLLDNISQCLSYNGPATIRENAIITIAPFMSTEALLALVPASSRRTTAAIIVGVREARAISATELHRVFSEVYGELSGEKLFISQMLIAMDNTEATENYHLIKELRLPVPTFMEEIELLSGLRLVTSVVSTGAAVTIKSELLNGENLRLVEGDLIINSMYEMMKHSISGYRSCPEELWESVLAAENSMITLIESTLNMNFENILKNDAISNIKSFFQLGGVQLKIVDEAMNADWILSMIENVQMFLTSESASKTPTIADVYTIFTRGIDTKYYNMFDDRQVMSVGLVSGMRLTSTVAHITAIDYNGNILPHMMSLGDSGDIKLQPSISHGMVYETELKSSSMMKTSTSVSTGHISFTGELSYEKTSTGLEFSMVVAPSASPMTLHKGQYMDNNFAENRHMDISVYPLLATNIIMKSCTQGFEITLDREINVQLALRYTNGYGIVASVGNLGKLEAEVTGELQDGAVSIAISDTSSVLTNGQVITRCITFSDCNINMDLQMPEMQPISSSHTLKLIPGSVAVHSATSMGNTPVMTFTGEASESNVQLLASSVLFGVGRVACSQSLTSTNPSKFIKCNSALNNQFANFRVDNTGNVLTWDIKTSVFALTGGVNPARQFRVTFYAFPNNYYSAANEITDSVLSTTEVLDVMAAWPVMSTGDRKIIVSVEYLQKVIGKTQMIYSSVGAHKAQLFAPAIDLKVSYDLDMATDMEISYSHAIQMNPKKLRRTLAQVLGMRINIKDIKMITDRRHLIIHKFDVAYPSNKVCSGQMSTPKGSLVSKIVVGTSSVCMSVSDQHLAIRAMPQEQAWKFDFVTSLNLRERSALWSLINQQISTTVTGQWVKELTGEQKELTLSTSVKASGSLLSEEIDARAEVSSIMQGDNIAAVLRGEWKGPFEYQLTGSFSTTTVGGITADTLTLVMPTNVLSVHGMKIFYKNQIPIGLSVAQSSFVGEWIVDFETPTIYLNLENSDEIIPLARSSFRADSTGMSVLMRTTAPRTTLDVDVVFFQSLRVVLDTPIVVMSVTPTPEKHQLSVSVKDAGIMKLDFTSSSPYVHLVQLGIDTTTDHMEIISGVAVSGSTRVVADGNGIPAGGLKIHQVFHIFGYDLHVDSEIRAQLNDAHTPIEAHFKWCDFEGEVSYGYFALSKGGSQIGSAGQWVTLSDVNYCSNTIAVYGNKYHQLASSFSADTVREFRIELPVSYSPRSALAPVVVEFKRTSADSAIAKVSTHLGTVQTTVAPSKVDVKLVSDNTDATISTVWSPAGFTTGVVGTIMGVSYQDSFVEINVTNPTTFTSNGQFLKANNQIAAWVLSVADGKTMTLRLAVEDSVDVDLRANVNSMTSFMVNSKATILSVSTVSQIALESSLFTVQSMVNSVKLIDMQLDFSAGHLALSNDLTVIGVPVMVELETTVNSVDSFMINGEGKIYSASFATKMGADQGVYTFHSVFNTVTLMDMQFHSADLSLSVNGDLTTIGVPLVVYIVNVDAELQTKLTLGAFHTTVDIVKPVNNIAHCTAAVVIANVAELTADVQVNIATLAHTSKTTGKIAELITWESSTQCDSLTIHETRISGAYLSAGSYYRKATSNPFTFELDLNEYEKVRLYLNGFGIDFNHLTTVNVSPLAVNSENTLTTSTCNVHSIIKLLQTEGAYNGEILVKTETYEGKITAVLQTDMSGVIVIYDQTGVAEASVSINGNGGEIKIDIPALSIISDLSVVISPINVNLKGSYDEHTVIASGNSKQLLFMFNDLVHFTSTIDTEIVSTLRLKEQGEYTLAVATDVLSIKFDCTDATIGVHKLAITSAVVYVKSSTAPMVDMAMEWTVKTVGSVEGYITGTLYQVPYNFVVSTPDLLLHAVVGNDKFMVEGSPDMSSSWILEVKDVVSCDINISKMEIVKAKINAPIIRSTANLVLSLTSADISLEGTAMNVPYAFMIRQSESAAVLQVEGLFQWTGSFVNEVIASKLTIVSQGDYSIQVSTNTINADLIINDVTVGKIEIHVTPAGATVAVSSPILQLETDLTMVYQGLASSYNVKGSFSGVDFMSSLGDNKIVISAPQFGHFELYQEGDMVVNTMSAKNIFANTLTVNTATLVITSEGTIVVPYTASVSLMDLYNLYVAHSLAAETMMEVLTAQLPMLTYATKYAPAFATFKNENGVVVTIAPNVRTVFVDSEHRVKVELASSVLTIDARYGATAVQAQHDMSAATVALMASVLETEINGRVLYVAPYMMDISVQTATTKYVATYANGNLALSVPSVAEVKLVIAEGGMVTGTISVINVADITINHMVVSRVTDTPLYMITDIDMIATIAGFEVAITAAPVNGGLQYKITCDIGAGMILLLNGATRGTIGSMVDLSSYDLESMVKLSVGNDYISQELGYTVMLSEGNMDGTVSINTAIIKLQMAVQTEGLTVNKLSIANFLLNTKFDDVEIFVNTGISYALDRLAIHQTHVKLDSDTIFLVGGGEDTPIAVDLNAGALVPNSHLVLKFGAVRVEAAYEALNNFKIVAEPFLVLSREGKAVHAVLNIFEYQSSTDLIIRKNAFQQSIQVMKGEDKIVVGKHMLNMKTQTINIDWLILDNVIKVNGVMSESANIQIKSPLFKLATDVTTTSLDLSCVSELFQLTTQLTPELLDLSLITEPVQIKTRLTADHTNCFVKVMKDNAYIIDASMNTIEEMEIKINAGVFTTLATVNSGTINAVVTAMEYKVTTVCQEYCTKAKMSLIAGNSHLVDATFAMKNEAYQIIVKAESTLVKVLINPTKTSVLNVNYADEYILNSKIFFFIFRILIVIV